jgi:hypothetical protein
MQKRKGGSKKPAPSASAPRAPRAAPDARSYEHTEADAALRPDVGVQKQFRGKKPPKTYRYDSSLSPSLEWDEQPARVQGEALIANLLKATTLEEAKAAHCWVAAVNAEGSFGRWGYEIVRDPRETLAVVEQWAGEAERE